MNTVTLIIIISGQVFILLLGVIGFLMVLLRRSSHFKQNLLEKTQLAIKEAEALALKQIAEMENQLNQESGSVEDFLDEAINSSIDEFQAKGGNHLSYSQDLNKDQLIAWLRYQLLLAEKSNLDNQQDDRYWQQLQDQLSDLLLVHDSASSDESGETSQELSDLQQAKTIIEERVNTIETQWSETQTDGHNIFQKIINLCASLPNGDQIVQLITDYHNHSLKLGSLITNEEYNPVDVASYLGDKSSGTKTQAKEIERLKTVNEHQHQVIVQLKDKLKSLAESDDPQKLIEEYEQQLAQLERLMRETDMCITTLESELDTAHQKIKAMESQGGGQQKDDDKSEYVNNIVEKFAHESRDLIATIRKLELDLSNYRESQNDEQPQQQSDPGLDSLLEKADKFKVNTSMPGINDSEAELEQNTAVVEEESSLSTEDIQALLEDTSELDHELNTVEASEPPNDENTPSVEEELIKDESPEDESSLMDFSDMEFEKIATEDDTPPKDILAEISAEETVSADEIDDLLVALDESIPDEREAQNKATTVLENQEAIVDESGADSEGEFQEPNEDPLDPDELIKQFSTKS